MKPMPQRIQPTAFLGRRETTNAPIVGYTSKGTPANTTNFRWDLTCGLWKSSNTASTARVAHSAQSDQASQVAARVLIPPSPRPCSFVPSVTPLLYSTTASKALRQPLRVRGMDETSTVTGTLGSSLF